ncbi:hypothetical protein D8M04_00265 [Oceanobacillus piezotolerans]|uniref:Uncharacterized protein n=1 Tax=Oceanobacillus piezotolerans TaxID=2448030 RepID=A0A498D8Z5_9BACI|nr:hypothetical protein D8M04_00265 [Oceanobacillus piezotolerans]
MFWINIDKSAKTITRHEPHCNFIPKQETKFKGLQRELRDGGWFSIHPYEYDQQFYYSIYPDFKRKQCGSCRKLK